MAVSGRRWGSLCLLALGLYLTVLQSDAKKVQRSSSVHDKLNPGVHHAHEGHDAEDEHVTFTSSSKKALHTPMAAHQKNKREQAPAHKVSKGVRRELGAADVKKAHAGPLTDTYFSSKKITRRSTRGEAVTTLIAALQGEGRSEFGNMVTLEEDTYSLNVHNNLLNHMRVNLPNLLDNYVNPTWVEDHPQLHTEVSPTSFFHQCYFAFRNSSKGNMSARRRAQHAVISARNIGGTHTATTDLNYNRRAACVPDFMVIGAHGLGSEEVAIMLKLQSRHVLTVEYDGYNYWDYRECTDALGCEFDFHPPTFADYKQTHQDVCEHVRRQSFFLEDRTEYHPDVVGDVFSGFLNWNPCWKKVPGNEGRLVPRVTTAHHVHALLPDLKVVVLMRDPMKKTLGLFRRMTKRPIPWMMEDAQAFNDQMTAEVAKFEECKTQLSMTNKQCVYHFIDNGEANIITQSIYHVFVEDYKRIFPAENIKYYRFEDFREDENGEQEQVVSFFGVPTGNGRGELPEDEPMDPGVDVFNSTRTMLKDFFRPHNEQLQILIGDEFNW